MPHRLRPASVRAGLLLVTVALLASGCGVADRTPISLAALVRDGAHATMSRRTADFTISGSIAAGGRTIPVSGSGKSDFSTHAMDAAMHMGIAGRAVTMTERLVGGHLYMGLDFAGETMKKLTGYDWYELPIPLTGSGGNLGDPAQMLQLAEQHGSQVVSLGATTIDGMPVEGYAVTPSRAAMLAKAKSRLGLLPPAQRAVALRLIRTSPPPTMRIWFDKTQDLLRRMVLQMSLSFAPGASAGGTIQFDFANYGTPVSIAVPQPSDVTTKAPGT